MKTFKNMLANESGQSLVEFAFIIALVAVVAIAGLKLLGGHVASKLSNAAARIPG
jgi:Flp pilus assembly pilin Flp